MKLKISPFINTIRFRTILLYSILILLSLSVMGFLFYNIYSNRVKSAAKQNLESIAELNANSIDVYFKEVINSIYTSAIDNDISNTLKDTDQKNYYRNMKLLRKELSNLTISNSNIRNVILISKLYNINLHTNSEEMIDFNSQTILDIIKSTYSSMYIKIKFLPLKKSDYMYTKGSADDLIVYFPIRDLQNREETLGIVLFQYNYQKLLETCSRSKIKYNNIIYLVDENEQPIITINNTGLEKIPIYSELKKSGNYLLVGSFIDSVSWKLVFAIDLKDLSKETIVVKKLATTIILISIIATILISISLGLKLTKSLNSISNNMYLFGTGDLSLRINENFATQELKILSNGFNEMADKIQTLINEAYSLEMKQKDAQIKALQARINPHFLYNSLQLISSLAILERTDDIQDAISSMADLYEYILYESKQTVSVEQELTQIHNYLKLQNLRLNNSLKITFKIDSNILNSPILKLSLQPVVENCIHHAFANWKKLKNIYITGNLVDEKIVFEIIDNGIGINREKLKNLLDKLKTVDEPERSIGLTNVHQRMQLFYGTEYGISIRTRLNFYTIIRIVFPFQK